MVKLPLSLRLIRESLIHGTTTHTSWDMRAYSDLVTFAVRREQCKFIGRGWSVTMEPLCELGEPALNGVIVNILGPATFAIAYDDGTLRVEEITPDEPSHETRQMFLVLQRKALN